MQIENIKKEIQQYKINNQKQLEHFKEKFIGKKSIIKQLFNQIKDTQPQQKKEKAIKINELKNTATKKFQEAIKQIQTQNQQKQHNTIPDLTLPTKQNTIGAIHPLTIIEKQIINTFTNIGFTISEGPEIEDDWHNFTALNFPQNHPARDMQDTFFIQNSHKLLRTHTSSTQIRIIENNNPPIKTISTGRVFRNEPISARSNSMFHQIEAIEINKKITIKHLKQTIQHLINTIFNNKTKTRFRSSYFPFTTPSIEIDIECQMCNTKGCKICKQTTWVELGGAGMIDPNVLKNCKIDPTKYSGIALGLGIERIAMLKYKIQDIRTFTENDIRFLKQFTHIS